MRVDNIEARDFYEREAIECGWSKTQLERQIHSFYHDQIESNQGKMGKLKHTDIGQMDGYVKLYEDQFKIPGDNPTISLILCSEKTEATAKCSILNESNQIFASKYLPNLPSEEQLQREINL